MERREIQPSNHRARCTFIRQFVAVIVSHTYRFIFFAVPKTGSQSIRAALRPHLAGNDWEQADWNVHLRAPIPALASVGHGHLSVSDVKPHLDSAIWRDYYKVACVRNPWDRFVSCAFFRNLNQTMFATRPRDCMKLLLRSPALMRNIFYRPQSDFLTEGSGALAIDCVMRFENLQSDFQMFCDAVGLPAVALPHLNQSAHDNAIQYYDVELANAVGRMYASDVEMFGYTLDELADHVRGQQVAALTRS